MVKNDNDVNFELDDEQLSNASGGYVFKDQYGGWRVADSHGQVHGSGKKLKSTAQFCAFNTGNGTEEISRDTLNKIRQDNGYDPI